MGRLKHEETTGKIIKAFYRVYNELGYGFTERVYENAMHKVFEKEGVFYQSQLSLPVYFEGEIIGEFFADTLVENRVMVEMKTASGLTETHEAQLLNYLKASRLEVGLLLNFGPEPQIKRMLFDNERKRPSITKIHRSGKTDGRE